MTKAFYLSIDKKKNSNIVTVAAQHNLRALGQSHGPNIDLRLTASNRVLRGPDTVDGVVGMDRALMQEAGVKLAKNTVRMVEVLVSLPTSTELSVIEQDVFFEQAAQWVERYFAVPILSAVLHRDEPNPHAHFLLLPLVDGRLKGSDLMGGLAQLRAMQADFYEQVAKHHGLTRKAPEQRLSASCRAFAADAIIEALQANPALLNDPDMVVAMRAAFGERPDAALKALRIEIPKPIRKPKRKAASSFAAQMTRPVKPDRENHPIGFAPTPGTTTEKTIPSLCVGFAIDRVSFQAEDGLLVGAGLPPTHGRRRLSPSSSSQTAHSSNTDRAGRKQ